MGDFIDFSYTLENISTLCTGDERVVYTLIHAFDYPHSHRVHGELQTGDGQITGALHLCQDFDDKHLEWPVKLEFKLLAYMNGNTEVLGTREIIWDVTNMKDCFEDISRRNSITVSLQDLKTKYNMVGADDSVTFYWSVKLSYPQPDKFYAEPQLTVDQLLANWRKDTETAVWKKSIPNSMHAAPLIMYQLLAWRAEYNMVSKRNVKGKEQDALVFSETSEAFKRPTTSTTNHAEPVAKRPRP